MKDLVINKKEYDKDQTNAPYIKANGLDGSIKIEGDAYGYTFDAEEHFKPLFEWLEKYLTVPKRNIMLNFWITYTNPQYAKYLISIINYLADYQENKQGVVEVNWYYEQYDLDMQEEGEEWQTKTNIEMNLIAYQKEE